MSRTPPKTLIEDLTNILYQMGEDWTEEFCPDLDAIAEQIIEIVLRWERGPQ
jgi:hypothetical protein